MSSVTITKITKNSGSTTVRYKLVGYASSLYVQWGTSTSNYSYYAQVGSTSYDGGTSGTYYDITIYASSTSYTYNDSSSYYFYMYGYDSSGTSFGFPSSNQTLYCNFAPSSVSVSKSSTTSSSIVLSVSKASNADSVDIFRDGTYIGSTSTSTYTDSTVSAGTTYSYYGVATNSINSLTKQSSSVSITAASATVTPTITFDSISISSSSATLYYTATNASGVYIYRSTTTTRPSTWSNFTTNTSYIKDSSVSAGTTYYYWVQAYYGSYSSPDATSTVAGYKSATIADTSPTFTTALTLAKQTSSPYGIKLSYVATNATSISIYRSTTSTISSTPYDTTTSLTYYNDILAIPGNTYYYRISATDGSTTVYSPSSTGYKSLSYVGTPTITLDSTAIGTSSITLNYTTNQYAYQVKIYRSTSSSISSSDLLDTVTCYDSYGYGTNDGSQYTDDTAEVGVTYYYAVQAICNSSYYSSITSAVEATIPADPTISSFTATLLSGGGAINLNWAGSAIDTIIVKKRAGSSGSYSTRITLTGTDALENGYGSFSDSSSLVEGTTYYYYIQATNNSSSNKATSAAKYVVYSDAIYPVLTDWPTTYENSAVSMTFTGTNVDTVRVYRGTSQSECSSNLTNDSRLATVTMTDGSGSYTDSSVESSTTYYYRYVAYNSSYSRTNTYPESSYVVIYTDSSATAPTVYSFEATGGDSNYISLAYSVTNADTVYINRRPAGTSDPFVAFIVDDLTGYTDTSVVAGQTYEYFIQAYNSTTKLMSDRYPTSGYCTATPGSGSGVAVTSFTGTATNSSVVLEYTVKNASYVEIYKTYVDTGTVELLYPESLTKYTDANVSIGSTYIYYIKAVDSSGNSATASSTYRVTIGGSSTTTASDLSASVSGRNVTLTYTTSGVDTVYIYRGTTASNITQVYSTPSPAQFTDMNLVPGYTYYYRIQGYNSSTKVYTDFVPSESTYVTATISSSTSTTPSVSGLALSVSNSNIVLTYTTENATGVEIQCTSGIGITEYTGGTSTYTDQNVKVGYTYKYRVRAFDGDGNYSAWTDWVSSDLATSYPTVLRLSASSNGSSIILDYAVVNADQIWVYKGTASNDLSTQWTTTETSSYTDTNVSSGYTYYYRIYAYNTTTGELSLPFPSANTAVSAVVNSTKSRILVTPQKADRGTKEHAITFADANLDIDNSTLAHPKNTWADWALVPSTRPLFLPPEPKYQFVDIPGADGVLDFTEILDVGVVYNQREGSNEFYVLNGYGDWQSRYSTIMNYLHGRKRKAFLDDDPGYYYVGRFDVDEWRSEKDWSKIVLNYQVDPYKYERQSSVEEWEWDYLNFDTGVIRDYRYIDVSESATLMIPGTTKRIIPSFYVSPTAWTRSTSSVTAGTIDSTFNWSDLATATFPSGFRYGCWGVSNGVEYANVGGTLYYMSVSKRQFNGYKSMVLTPPSDKRAWICEYDSTGSWITTYGKNDTTVNGQAITVPITENNYYTFTFASFEGDQSVEFFGNEISYGWEAGCFNFSTGALVESDYTIRSKCGFSFVGWQVLYVTPPSGCSVAALEFSSNATFKKCWSVENKTLTLPLDDNSYYYFVIGIPHSVTNEYSDSSFLSTIGFSKWTYAGLPDLSEWSLGLSKSVTTDANASIYTSSMSTNETLIVEVLALRCWSGMYGVGDTRKTTIESLGYDYTTVQNRVNEMSTYFGVNASQSYDWTSLNSKLVSAGYMTSDENYMTMTIPARTALANTEQTRPATSIDTSTNVAGLTVTIGNETFLIGRGWTHNPNIIIGEDETYLNFYGYGQVTVYYRGAIL